MGRQTNTMAIVSLVAGLLGFVGFCPLIGSIVAIITGMMALGQIRESPGLYEGAGLAKAGIALGAISLVLMCLGGVCFVLFGFMGAASEGMSLLPAVSAPWFV